VKLEWIHPSWRDLVIDELAADPVARRAFLARAEIEGLLLALSVNGGPDGRRQLPLLRTDADWDTATARTTALVRGADDHWAGRLLRALAEGLDVVGGFERVELGALAQTALDATRRTWTAEHSVLALPTLEAWLLIAHRLEDTAPAPVVPTWASLEPPNAFAEPLRALDWMTLATALATWRPDELHRLGFPYRYLPQLRELRAGADAAPQDPVWHAIAVRLQRLGLLSELPRVPDPPQHAAPQHPRPHRASRAASIDAPSTRDIVDRILDDL
jgi:hypothetical protein